MRHRSRLSGPPFGPPLNPPRGGSLSPQRSLAGRPSSAAGVRVDQPTGPALHSRRPGSRRVIHEPAPTLEQVGAPVGRLDPVADHVRQSRLDHLPGMVCLLTQPVPEARPEAVRHRRDVQLPEQFRQRRVRERLASNARKHQRTAARERPRRQSTLKRIAWYRSVARRGQSPEPGP